MEISIPKMTDTQLSKLSETIKPTYRFDDILHYIEPVDIKTTSYIWNPKKTKEATGLQKLCDITTYHTWGYYGFFKPSIAEVLWQIPEEYWNKVVAFEIIKSPQTAEDLNQHLEELNAGYHVATTRLYTHLDI